MIFLLDKNVKRIKKNYTVYAYIFSFKYVYFYLSYNEKRNNNKE